MHRSPLAPPSLPAGLRLSPRQGVPASPALRFCWEPVLRAVGLSLSLKVSSPPVELRARVIAGQALLTTGDKRWDLCLPGMGLLARGPRSCEGLGLTASLPPRPGPVLGQGLSSARNQKTRVPCALPTPRLPSVPQAMLHDQR